MIDKNEIEKLAKLSRIFVSSGEMDALQHDIKEIISYVEQIQEVSGEAQVIEAGKLRNVMREDGEPYKSGIFTETLLKQVPLDNVKDNFVKVRKIIDQG